MSFFKSTPAEPVDEHLAPLLIDDSAYQRKVLVKFQSSVSHWAAGSGEGIEVLSGFDGGDHLLVITNRSVCQFSKFMKYGLWKRLPYAEIPDRGVGIHGHKCNETLKYINVESDRARRFSEQDERRINYVITGTVATDKALAIAEALMAHTDRYARLLAEKYASIVVAAEARAERCILRLVTGGPLELTRPIAVSLRKAGVARHQASELYRGNPNFKDVAMADTEAKKAFDQFDRHLSELRNTAWQVVAINGREIVLQR